MNVYLAKDVIKLKSAWRNKKIQSNQEAGNRNGYLPFFMFTSLPLTIGYIITKLDFIDN
jgi:hypothetical protein